MASIEGWVEVALFSVAFVAILGIIVVAMNFGFDKSNTLPFTDSSGINGSLVEYSKTGYEGVTGGEVVYGGAYQTLTLKNSIGLLSDILGIVWKFLNGTWIRQIAISLNLGEPMIVLANYLSILWLVGLIFIVLYVLFKVVI